MIDGILDPELTQEQIAQLPSCIDGVNIRYRATLYRPAARPAYPEKGE